MVTGQQQSGTVELEVMVTAQVKMPHAYIFRSPSPRLLQLAGVLAGRGEAVAAPCLAFLVRHQVHGSFLIDTGLHPDASTDLRKDFGLAMSILFRNVRPTVNPWVAQLRELGTDPAEVGRVVMTHLHVDHTSGMRLLPNARFSITSAEWETTQRPRADAKGFIARHLPPPERVDLIDFKQQGEPYRAFSRTIDLLGDGSVRLISTPGHTPGHISLLLQVTGGRQVLLVGDAAYTRESIEQQTLPLLTDSDELYLASLRELKAFTDQEPEAVVIPSHDPTAWRQLREVSSGAGRSAATRA